jgi:signal transduction histidine kinase
VPLRELIDECFAVVPFQSHVSLVNDVPADMLQPELDKDQIRQVFVNLIQNASEAMPSSSPGTVTVSAKADHVEGFKIEVRDDGVGIPAEQLEKIFQPLFSTKTKGTGLGLAIVQQMVERHSGQIRVESEVDVGTTFFVKFPAPATPSRVHTSSIHPSTAIAVT